MDYFHMAAKVEEAEEKKKQKSPRKFRLPEADSTPAEPQKEEPQKEEPSEPEKEEPAE